MWWIIAILGLSAYIGQYGIIPIIITSVVVGMGAAIATSVTYEIGSLLSPNRLKNANRLLLLISTTARFRIVSEDDTTHTIQINIMRLPIWTTIETFSELTWAQGVIHNFYNRIDEAQAKLRRKKMVTNVSRKEDTQ